MHRRFVVAAILAVVWAAPAAAHAQTPDGLAGLLLRFFSPTNPVVLQAAPDPFSHAAHFISQPNAQETLRQLNRGIASQLSTFPLGSSSAGFTYTFDPELGVFNRSTETFGPVFSERPLTAGKGKFSFGATQLHATYDRFEGQDLREGDIKLYLTHEDTNRDTTNLNPWFEGDIIESALSIDLKNDTTVFYANYGVSDRFDIGVAIPYQRLDLSARIDARIEHLATAPDPFVVHTFPEGQGDDAAFFESGSAEGIGDVVLRGKYNFFRGTGTSVAAALDLRLPTGDSEDLLGSGATQAKISAIAARVSSKRFSPRIAAGYTLSSGGADFVGELPDEINYSAGFDAALHSRVTLTADFLGRTLLDADRLVLRDRVFENVLRTDPTVRQTTRTTTETTTGNLNLMIGSAGLKVNPAGRLLLMVNLLFGIGDSGLQDDVTPVFGIDYSF
jgi:hypothetical protein